VFSYKAAYADNVAVALARRRAALLLCAVQQS